MYGTIQGTQPRQGRTGVGTTPKPITQVGNTSSAGTTFTKNSVVDGAVWDLSAAKMGYIITTSDGFRATITAVNNGANKLTLEGGWVSESGRTHRGLAEMKPADGAVVTIHKMEHCGLLVVDALDANSASVFLGFDSAVSYDPASANVGHEIVKGVNQPNHRLVIEPKMANEIDLTQVYIVAASATQYACWIGM